MSIGQMSKIWIEQCNAAQGIKLRYGTKAAFEYVVAEKLVNFAGAASQHPEFARELPQFVSCVRSMFTPHEIRTHIARVEREQAQKDIDVPEDDIMLPETPAAVAEHARQLAMIKELLTVAELGTS